MIVHFNLEHRPFDWRKPLTIMSHLIRKVAKVFNNHGSIRIAKKVFEAEMTGVEEVELLKWKKNQLITTYEVKLTPEQLQRVYALKDTKYDYWSLFLWQPIYIITGLYLGNTKARKAAKRLYCFEYLAYVLGLPNFYKITPQEINDYLDKHYNKIYANIPVEEYIFLTS